MPQQQLLETTGREGFALQVNGRAVVGSHEQLIAIIKSRLGQNHADFLASPGGQTSSQQPQGSIRWSTHLTGEVKAADVLEASQRAKLEATAQRLASDIRGLAMQMQTEGAATQVVGQMLERCVQIPPGMGNATWLFSVGGKPVTVLWGHSGTSAAVIPTASNMTAQAAASGLVSAPANAASTALNATVAAQQSPAQADYIDVQARAVNSAQSNQEKKPWLRWLAWLLLALLLLALLLFGLKSCLGGSSGVAASSAALAEATQQNKLLEDEIAKKKRELTQYQCVPEPTKPVEPPAPLEPPKQPASEPDKPLPLPPVKVPKPKPQAAQAAPALSEDQRRVRDRGGRAGKLEITLAWGSQSDIDLHVTCPTGAVIFAKALSACGGALDIDANGSGNRRVNDPVEHVVFANPAPGQYSIAVANCERTGSLPEPFRVTVEYEGRVIRQSKGSSAVVGIAQGSGCGVPILLLSFSIPP